MVDNDNISFFLAKDLIQKNGFIRNVAFLLYWIKLRRYNELILLQV